MSSNKNKMAYKAYELFQARHSLVDGVETLGVIFSDVNFVDGYSQILRKLNEEAQVFVDKLQHPSLLDYRDVRVVVSGLTPAVVALINAWKCADIMLKTLTLLHFDKSSNTYVEQEVK